MTRRAISLLDEDIDALEEAWEKAGLRGARRTVKVQAPGPITLAAQLELANGHRAITDAGALRDLAASLAEGRRARTAREVARRLERTVVVQFDEPSLPAALAGRLTGVTGLTPVHPVDEAVAIGLLDECVAPSAARWRCTAVRRDCRGRCLQRSSCHAVSVDVSTLTAADLDGIGEFVESGRTVMLGVVPATAPDRRPSVEEVAKAAVAITDRLGFPARCCASGSASRRPAVWPGRPRSGRAPRSSWRQKAADAIAEDPDAILK